MKISFFSWKKPQGKPVSVRVNNWLLFQQHNHKIFQA